MPEIKDEFMALRTGRLSREEVQLIFDMLPVDITFVGKDDDVRYFNKLESRIFKRAPSVIGLKVQNCHPKKSIDKVQQILDEFRAGKREVAEFWINLKGRMVHIRYFPIYDSRGEYTGCLEVTQDITDIKKIKGEKRLL